MNQDPEMVTRYRKLVAEHHKAQRKEGEWRTRAADLARKVESFRVVMEELGIEPDAVPAGGGDSVSLKDAMAEAARRLGSDITVETIRPMLPASLQDKEPATYSSTLIRLWKTDKVLHRDERGVGNKQSVYSWVGDGDEAEAEAEEQPRLKAVSLVPMASGERS